MRTLFLDFETYYDKEYTLRKMTPVEYVLDPRFEAIGCAVKEGVKGTGYWVKGSDLQRFFDDQDPKTTHTVTYNALFDNCIFAWKYNFYPRLMTCAMAVARATVGYKLRSLALASVANFLGIGQKGDTVHKVQGMCAADIEAAGLMESYINYSLQDNELCAGIYDELVRARKFPLTQLAVMDMVLRCAIQPQFRLDVNALHEHHGEVVQEKNELLAQAMLVGANGKPALRSDKQFAELLKSHGVDPPTKISPVTGKTAFAFAKGDPAFTDLLEHPNPAVQTLVSARIGNKSTIEETRTQRLINISQLTWPGNSSQLMPIPLGYGRAHTHRLGGEWKLNMQNLPVRKNNKIRCALIAPPGHKVVLVDSAQIQARLTAWICGQMDLVEAFGRGEDVYASFASEVFGYEVTKKSHPPQRFVGKTGILSLGFGAGWARFQLMVQVDSLAQMGAAIILTDEEALKVNQGYRRKYNKISGTWKAIDRQGIPVLAGNGGSYSLGPCVFEKGKILLPNGLCLFYDNLSHGVDGWTFTYGGITHNLWGGTLLENIIQALEVCIVMDAALRIQKRQPLAIQVHDELGYIVRDELVERFKLMLMEELNKRPDWAPDLPLSAEVNSGQSYGDAK